MMMTLPKPLATVARVLLDFAMGVTLFTVAVCMLTAGHGATLGSALGSSMGSSVGSSLGSTLAASASQGEGSHWLTTVYPSNSAAIVWTEQYRTAAIILLAMSFGVITALNMAIARHLQRVATTPSAPSEAREAANSWT